MYLFLFEYMIGQTCNKNKKMTFFQDKTTRRNNQDRDLNVVIVKIFDAFNSLTHTLSDKWVAVTLKQHRYSRVDFLGTVYECHAKKL